jgi:radical SAM superfamily enzyme YgiQ (UPF0313 family)
MNIVLSTSPHIKHSSVLDSDFKPRNDLMYTFAPLGILMLCAMAREKWGITPQIYDINSAINNNEITNDEHFYSSSAQSIAKLQPTLLGFMTECDSYHHVLQICSEVKKILPNCFITLGGPHATAVAEKTMERWDCVDCIILGEGEITFAHLIQQLSLNQSNTDIVIPGAITRGANGDIIKSGNRPLIEHLDELPMPAYDLYSPAFGEELFVEVGRGCPFQCTFCSTSPFWSRKHRVKSPERIVSEIKYIRELHGTSRFHFTHDLFTANNEWAAKVCSALISAGLNIRWTCSSRIDTISEGLIKHMAKAGCNAIFFGIESGSERVLDVIQKGLTLSRTYEIVSLCHKYGIASNAGLIVGFPFEDTQSFSETFDLYLSLMKLGTKPLHIFSFCPFTQSTLFTSLKNMECSGHFLDIPLSDRLSKRNRLLIATDYDLFASYFRPRLDNIAGMRPGMIYAVDEFALLVDSVRVPSMIIASHSGGMSELFFKWIAWIELRNQDKERNTYRKYFGSPIEYCEFLTELCCQHIGQFPEYVLPLLLVMKKNFDIASKLSHREPNSMATYRSKAIDPRLTEIHFESSISYGNVIETIELPFDVVPILYSLSLDGGDAPVRRKTNLVWMQAEDGNVSLIQVNDFIFYLLTEVKEKTSCVKDILSSWTQQGNSEMFIYSDILSDVQKAVDANLVTLNIPA